LDRAGLPFGLTRTYRQATEKVVNAIAQENQVCQRAGSARGTMVPMPLDDSLEKEEQDKAGKRVESHPQGLEPGRERRRLEVEQCATQQRSCCEGDEWCD
jgi:hypothetical protein